MCIKYDEMFEFKADDVLGESEERAVAVEVVVELDEELLAGLFELNRLVAGERLRTEQPLVDAVLHFLHLREVEQHLVQVLLVALVVLLVLLLLVFLNLLDVRLKSRIVSSE